MEHLSNIFAESDGDGDGELSFAEFMQQLAVARELDSEGRRSPVASELNSFAEAIQTQILQRQQTIQYLFLFLTFIVLVGTR